MKLSIVALIVFLNVSVVTCTKKLQRERYLEYLPLLFQCECGVSKVYGWNQVNQNRVIGGVPTQPHQFPWLVLLQYENFPICGGSIISDLYVLTAAHCFVDGFKKDNLKVVVGQHNWCQQNSDTVTLSISKVIIHADFDKTTYFADIMLLRLSMRLTYNENIKPICLPKYAQHGTVFNYAGQNALVVGWGVTESGSKNVSCIPMKLYQPILEQNECDTQVTSLFCAGFPEGGRDTCAGDSGSPLQYKSFRKRYEIIGIVSSGFGCALPGHPTHYTDVNQYIPWILRNSADSNTCS